MLYLLASSVETKKVDSLARGGKVMIGNQYKTLSQLTIKDVLTLNQNIFKTKKTTQEQDDQEDDERDLERARSALDV